jgi:NAD(P)-dependent dehydrogenase (short-subunit alcohol dehydrogenase family)
MAFSISDTPSLTGSVALVTGGNSGLGLASVKALASKGCHVLLGARDTAKGERAATLIRDQRPGSSIEVLQLDLASQASIRSAVEEVVKNHERVDILMNNAGIMAMPEMTTDDGYESQFGVNHLGHWTLTALLMPKILAAPSPRVVTVTSSAHHLILGIDFRNPHMRGKYSPWNAYSQSKLANYFFALGLHREFVRNGKRAMSLLAHPGLSHTNLQVETQERGAGGATGAVFKFLAAKVGMSPDAGALPQLRAALDPKAKSGEFYAPRFLSTGAPVTRPFLRPNNGKNIEKLWQLSQRETGVALTI